MKDFLRGEQFATVGTLGNRWAIRGHGLIDNATKAMRFNSEAAAQRVADAVNARLVRERRARTIAEHERYREQMQAGDK